MIGPHPAVKHGRAVWDPEHLPAVELTRRVEAVRESLRASGFAAAVVLAHTADAGDVAYLAGFVPMSRWAAVVIGLTGDPTLVVRGASRELTFVQSQTWIGDVSVGFAAASAIAAALERLVPNRERIAVVGRDTALTAAESHQLDDALAPYEGVAADGLVADLRMIKTPLELELCRLADEFARTAVADAVLAFTNSATNAEAATAAERRARLDGAHDVRVLANIDGPQLAPIEGRSCRQPTLALHCAIESHGYWGSALSDTGVGDASRWALNAVTAMTDQASPGAPVSALVDAALGALPPSTHKAALAYGFGAGIGTSHAEQPMIRPGTTARLLPSMALSLRAVVPHGSELGAAGAMIVVGTTSEPVDRT